jgi:hypothetical protein
MSRSWLKRLLKKSRPLSRSARRHSLTLETLEDRTVPTFLPAVTFPVGVLPGAVTVADFNNDGKLDLAVVNQGPISTSTPQSSVSVLLGNGNGSFQPAVTTALLNGRAGNGNALSVVTGDFNGHGLSDVALTTSGGPAGPAVEVLLGKGDGSFQPNHLTLPVGQTPLSVAAGDFDHNGTLDLVTANSNGTASVLLGNGDGSFRPRTDLTVGAAPRSVAVGDFNGDGKLDVAVAQQLSDTVSILLGNGDGTFARPLVFTASGANFTPDSMLVRDVNGDGKLDLTIKSISFLDSDAFQVGVLLGNGDGTFRAPLLAPAQPDGSGDLALGDFNGDGKLDVAVAAQLGAPTGDLSVFFGNGDGTFQPNLRMDLPTGGNDPKGVAAVDLNGDGLADLVATNASSGTVGVLLSTSPGATPTITATFSVDGTLRVTGDDQDNTIVVSRDAAGNILVNGGAVPIQGGPATVANTSLILLNGGAGNDRLTLDETNGAVPVARLDGGAGDDVLTGGSAGDVFDGAAGNDTMIGGAGSDTFVWSPGDGSDTVEGGGGKVDALTFNGSDLAEKFDVSANGSHVRLTRDLGAVTMDVSGVEAIEVNAAGGADTITVGDLSGTDAREVNVDLGAADGAADAVVVNGTDRDDAVQILAGFIDQTPITVLGLSPRVDIAGAEGANDTLRVNTLGGNDVVDSSGLPAGEIGLTVDLGDGQVTATRTTLDTSAATTVSGPAVTLTATVTSAAGVPTGTVTFLDGTTVLGTARIGTDGQAVLKVSLAVGSHALTASFAGTGGFADSTSAAVTETVNRAATTVALASSVNPAATGQAVTFTARVAVVAPGAGAPSGTVTFKDGNAVLGTATVGRDGTATLTTSFAAAGGHVITAVYSGDSNFVGSSQALTEQVKAHKQTTTFLSASANPARVGQAVTFTATVRNLSGTGTPTGTVTFFVGNTVVARVRLDASGRARLTGFFSVAGRFTIRAVYSGDAIFDTSSQSLIEQVNR